MLDLPTQPSTRWMKQTLELTVTGTLKRKSSRGFGESNAFEAAIGETRQLESKTMFCFNTVKTDFSGKAFREAIYKAALRGSERPQRVNAASGKKKSFGSPLKTGSICAGT